jgi:hypothetical protein
VLPQNAVLLQDAAVQQNVALRGVLHQCVAAV